MQLRTEITPPEAPRRIDYADHILCMGSCFAENIGKRFIDNRMNALVNPFGILFNPMSIAMAIRRMIATTEYTSNDLIQHQGIWHSFAHHGCFSSSDMDQTLNAINRSLVKASHEIRHCNYLFLTFGTSWVYEWVETQQIVANCHKLPDKNFNRYRLCVDRIVELYKKLLIELLEINPGVQIVLTVSPVRHWKDGANGNQLSKAVLLLAVDQLCKLFECASYFPAYEIVLDDLRDYRFFDDDMLHPSSVAIDYVWEKFAGSWFNRETVACCKAMEPIVCARHHRPLHPDTDAYLQFVRNMMTRIEQVKQKFPLLDLNDDLLFFQNKIR
ncbi:GSCFA family protein [Breznakibacter xylanolyticus]|uniref:GSCFA family protein n=1 Tax=Breznakibacter xylanolyticus TaxID=990 RepID=A0A2W7NJF8_9BACT|nr:GSCFA domain-containing protein [Breznakibacter xylanolyticus]MBN2744281.1 GSCFA domain-containing protein [Marinilabiliaceae bacterium]PZX20591.1 GSCFA family protein [Breznakibacter xylanolyticus]